MKPNDTQLVACRLTPDFKLQVTDYALKNDLSVSQVIRKGLRLVVEHSSKMNEVRSGWQVR